MAEAPPLTLFAWFPTRADAFVCRPLHQGDVGLHRHDFVEVAMVISGHGLHRTIAGLTKIRRGDTFVIHPGQWHAYERCEDMHIFNCCFVPSLLEVELGWLEHDPVIGRLVARSDAEQAITSCRVDDAGVLTALGVTDRIRALQGGDAATMRADIIAQLLMLLAELGRQWQRAPASPAAAGASHPAVARAMELLEQDVAHDWSLEELAERIQLDRSHFIRLFRRCTGLTPMLWLSRCRGERAAVLLLTSDEPVADIGRAVGWNDPNYFSRRFRSLFGLSPREYRSQLPCPPRLAGDQDSPQW